jgi:predicted methyltransferase
MQDSPQRLEKFLSRQARKRHLAFIWASLAGLRPGMTILDIGSGPALLAATYAALTGPTGLVYAIEPSLSPAETAQNLIHLAQDATTPIILPTKPDIAFLTDTLHHAQNPEKILAAVHATTPQKILVADYDPTQPGLIGAKPHRRLPRQAAKSLIQNAGFTLTAEHDAPDEHYALLAIPTT